MVKSQKAKSAVIFLGVFLLVATAETQPNRSWEKGHVVQPLIEYGKVTTEQMKIIVGTIPPYTNVNNITAVQRDLLAQVFYLRPVDVTEFRWGPSLAPVSHSLHKAIFLTIWHWKNREKRRQTHYILSGGHIKKSQSKDIRILPSISIIYHRSSK